MHTSRVKIAFIGAGSTIFMKNIVGDILTFPALRNADIALMDIDAVRLEESRLIADKITKSLHVKARITTYTDQRIALDGADFVIVAFQIGGYDPCTITDFEIPKRYGVQQTIADTLGVGGIMRGLRTVPHLWRLCDDMRAVCPQAMLLQYVNPMAINTAAIAVRYPDIHQIGLCHSVQNTVADLAYDLDISPNDIHYRAAGINHVSFLLDLKAAGAEGMLYDLYPVLKEKYQQGLVPKPNRENPRCPNVVRYELMQHFGFFVTESSEHFAEYVPWFIKSGRPDLIERFSIPLDEYPQRCIEQINDWQRHIKTLKDMPKLDIQRSHEYAADIINAVITHTPTVIYGNVGNNGYIPQLPRTAAVEVACLIDGLGVHPTRVNDIPPHLIALMRTNINVQELTVAALVEENIDHIYHAAMLDPHTAAELDLQHIRNLVDDLIMAHGDWLPKWCHQKPKYIYEQHNKKGTDL